MLGIISQTQPPAARVLKLRTFKRLLDRYRLLSYSTMIGAVDDGYLSAYRNARRLYGQIFPESRKPTGGPYDVEVQLLGRIHNELFPVDLEAYDEVVWGGETFALWLPIWPESYGIPWEVCPVHHVEDHYAPIGAAAISGLQPEYEHMQAYADERYNDALGWLARKGFTQYKVVTDQSRIFEQLNALPVPFNGMAVAYQCFTRASGNSFIDNVPAMWDGEYEDWETRNGWTAWAVEMYALDYRAAKPKLAQLQAYIDWFKGKDAVQATMKVLELIGPIFHLAPMADHIVKLESAET